MKWFCVVGSRGFRRGTQKRGAFSLRPLLCSRRPLRLNPDPLPRLLNLPKLKKNRLVIGGKSMGGRIASQVAAADGKNIAGLVLLGYPLHPPGKPDKLRDAHLKDVRAPMLFVQGSRDAFGTKEEIRGVIKKLGLPAKLYVVEGGDHSFKVPKSAGVTPQQVHEIVMNEFAAWLHSGQYRER